MYDGVTVKEFVDTQGQWVINFEMTRRGPYLRLKPPISILWKTWFEVLLKSLRSGRVQWKNVTSGSV